MNTLSDKAVDASAFALPWGVGVSVRPTNEKEKRL